MSQPSVCLLVARPYARAFKRCVPSRWGAMRACTIVHSWGGAALPCDMTSSPHSDGVVCMDNLQMRCSAAGHLDSKVVDLAPVRRRRAIPEASPVHRRAAALHHLRARPRPPRWPSRSTVRALSRSAGAAGWWRRPVGGEGPPSRRGRGGGTGCCRRGRDAQVPAVEVTSERSRARSSSACAEVRRHHAVGSASVYKAVDDLADFEQRATLAPRRTAPGSGSPAADARGDVTATRDTAHHRWPSRPKTRHRGAARTDRARGVPPALASKVRVFKSTRCRRGRRGFHSQAYTHHLLPSGARVGRQALGPVADVAQEEVAVPSTRGRSSSRRRGSPPPSPPPQIMPAAHPERGAEGDLHLVDEVGGHQPARWSRPALLASTTPAPVRSRARSAPAPSRPAPHRPPTQPPRPACSPPASAAAGDGLASRRARAAPPGTGTGRARSARGRADGPPTRGTSGGLHGGASRSGAADSRWAP